MTIQKSTATYQGVAVECAKITADKPCTWRFSKTLNFSGSYAWQFVIKADEDTQVDVTVGNQTETFDVSTEFELFSHVFENVEADNYPYVEINFPIGVFYIYHTQLEYGDEPTEYNPSGGGIEQDMYDLKKGVRTIIEQLGDKISLVVDGSSTSSSLVLTQDTLDAVANDINLNGRVTFSGLDNDARGNYFGTCSTLSTMRDKVVVCSDFPELYKGVSISVQFTNKNAHTTPYLNVNDTGAKLIYAYGSPLPATGGHNWDDGATVDFVYDGTYWQMINPKANAIANNIYHEGTTQIDGGKIYTGSVTAQQIDVDDLFAQNVTATGTITGVTIKGASGEFTEKFFTDVVLQDTVGNEINGKMYFDPSNKLFKVLIASPEYGDDPQAPFYGTMEFSNQNMSIGHAHNVSIFSQDGKISLSAPIGGICLSPSVSCNEFHANDQFSVSSGGKFIINNANGSGNSKILTSTSSGMAFKSLYDLAVTEGNGTFTNTTISSGTWKKIGKFTIPKGKYLIITQADISTASGGTYTNGVVGLGINTGTSTKSSYTRFDSKVNCNAGSVYLQNVRVVSSSSSTDINVWVHSTMANAMSVDAGFMYLGLPG